MSKKITPFSWMLGFIGFSGFAGLYGYPQYFLLFALFSGFQNFWWFKLGSQDDERLSENRLKAGLDAFKIAMMLLFVSTIILSLLNLNYFLLYKLQLFIIGITFAIGTNLWAYLTYKYDRDN